MSNRPEHQSLYVGDNLEWLSKWEDECIDLIYLDPPFNSKANYNMTFAQRTHKSKKPAQLLAFTDMWNWTAKDQNRL